MKRRDFLKSSTGLLAVSAFPGKGIGSRIDTPTKVNPYNKFDKKFQQTGQVVVIGAGMSGLASAYLLSLAGFKVTLLEKNSKIGGRVQTFPFHGNNIELGAQILAPVYEKIFSFIDRHHLRPEVREFLFEAGIVRNRQLKYVKSTIALDNTDNMIKLLESFRDAAISGFELLKIRATTANLNVNVFSDWAKYDGDSGVNWGIKNLNNNVTNYLLDPVVEALTLQNLETTSSAAVVAILKGMSEKDRAYTLKDGFSTVPHLLAKQIKDLRLNCEVTQVEQLSRQVQVTLSTGERIESDFAVLATPAPITQKYYQGTTYEEQKILSRTNGKAIRIFLGMKKGWKPENIREVFFYARPEVENPHNGIVKTAILCSRMGNFSWEKAKGEIVDVTIATRGAETGMEMTEQELKDQVLKELPEFGFTNVTPENIEAVHVQKWDVALGEAKPGDAQAVKLYKKCVERDLEKRIFLASDSISMSYTEAVVESGWWAAEQVVARVR